MNLPLIKFGVIIFLWISARPPSPVSWTVVPRFNRVGSYIPETSTPRPEFWASFAEENFLMAIKL